MAIVQVQGVFMGVSLKTSNFDGNVKTKLNVDIYQPESESNIKSITVSTEQIDLLTKFQKQYTIGSPIKMNVLVNSYKNATYFKLIDTIEAS